MKTVRPPRFPSTRSLSALAAAFCLTGLAFTVHARTTGSGHVITETRKVHGLRGIELDIDGDVTIIQGDAEGLVIEGEDNILPLIKTSVDGEGILTIGFKDHAGGVEFNRGLNFKLSIKTLDKVRIVGAGSIRAASLAVVHPRMSLLGSGKIQVDHLKSNILAVEVDGSGEVTLAGETHQELVVVDGAGTYTAKNVKAVDAVVEVNGAGRARVWATGTLEADVHGAGEIGFYGSPVLKKSISGAGEVKALGAKNG